MNVGGPSSQSGRRQVGASDAGYWIATIGGLNLSKTVQILEWRGLMASLNGMVGEVVVGPFDCTGAPWPRVDGKLLTRVRGTTHSDSSTFDDDGGYSQSTIDVSLAADLPLRATHLQATVTQAGQIRRGQYFSIRNRLHIITSFPQVDGADVSFDFMPPARAAAPAGTPIDFANPKATMRLSDPGSGELEINLRRFASPTLDLEESFLGL